MKKSTVALLQSLKEFKEISETIGITNASEFFFYSSQDKLLPFIMKELGIIRKEGKYWDWIAEEPTLKMAQTLREVSRDYKLAEI